MTALPILEKRFKILIQDDPVKGSWDKAAWLTWMDTTAQIPLNKKLDLHDLNNAMPINRVATILAEMEASNSAVLKYLAKLLYKDGLFVNHKEVSALKALIVSGTSATDNEITSFLAKGLDSRKNLIVHKFNPLDWQLDALLAN